MMCRKGVVKKNTAADIHDQQGRPVTNAVDCGQTALVIWRVRASPQPVPLCHEKAADI